MYKIPNRYPLLLAFGFFLYLILFTVGNQELNYNLIGHNIFFVLDDIAKLSIVVLSFLALTFDDHKKNTLSLFFLSSLVLCSGNLHTVFLSLELLLLVQVILGNLENFKFHFLSNKLLFIAILGEKEISILIPISLIVIFFVWIGTLRKDSSGERDLLLGFMISVVLVRFSKVYWPLNKIALSVLIIISFIMVFYFLWKVFKTTSKNKNLSYLIKCFFILSLLGCLMGGASDALFYLFNGIITLSLVSKLLEDKNNINQSCFTVVGVLLLTSFCAVPALGGHFPLAELLWFLIGQFQNEPLFAGLSLLVLILIYLSFSRLIILFLEKRAKLKNEEYTKEDYLLILSCLFVVTFGYLGISEMFTSSYARIIQKEMEIIIGQKENIVAVSTAPQFRNIMAIIAPFLFLATPFIGLQLFSKGHLLADIKPVVSGPKRVINIKRMINNSVISLLGKLFTNCIILIKNIIFWGRDYLYRYFYRETNDLVVGIRPILIWVMAFFIIILGQAGLK